MERRGRLDRIVEWIGIGPIALHVFTAVRAAVALQWDFRAYLIAARVARAGIDPYVTANLASESGRSLFPFVYPPIALLFFMPLAALPLAAAQTGWIAFKIVLLIGLVWLWKRVFVPGVSLFPLVLLAVFGWGQSALWDLRTGNVALIEAALVWSALAFYVCGRRTWFACLIVAAALFKLWPAFLLLLLLVPAGERGPQPRTFAIAALALGALVWGPTWIGPAASWGNFLSQLPSATRLGGSSPSALGLATMLVATRSAQDATTTMVANAAWLAYLVVLAAVSLPFLRRLWAERDALRWAMSAVFLWVLIAPRPMAYGYAVLTPVPLFFSPRPFTGRLGTLLLAVVLSAQGLAQAARQGSSHPLILHSPFILTLCVWLLVINEKGAARSET